MIICLCHRVSDRDITRAVKSGCRSFEELQDDTRVGTGCGACLCCAREYFDDQLRLSEPVPSLLRAVAGCVGTVRQAAQPPAVVHAP
jgi:bacterioferritin-associated ferredoxin